MILHHKIFLFLLNLRLLACFNVVGYMPEWRHEGADFDRLCQHLTHLIFFSLEMTPKGEIVAMDRIPRTELLAEARAAATKHKTKLLLCFGGNGRSGGFSVMVRNEKNRRQFLVNLMNLLDEYEFDGVDYNWEYPGYRMGRGYLEEKEIYKDYEGLATLVKETKLVFKESGRVVSVAYYPDTRQEQFFKLFGIDEHVDLMYAMSYDQSGPNHSSKDLAKQTIKQAKDAKLLMNKVCVGVPFYGRDNRGGDWVTYEDLVQENKLTDKQDEVDRKTHGTKVGFNGRGTISWKVKHAIKERIGGVMIWEVGQDCRVNPVTRGDTVHVKTCPDGEKSSLLAAISEAIKSQQPSSTTKDEF